MTIARAEAIKAFGHQGEQRFNKLFYSNKMMDEVKSKHGGLILHIHLVLRYMLDEDRLEEIYALQGRTVLKDLLDPVTDNVLITKGTIIGPDEMDMIYEAGLEPGALIRNKWIQLETKFKIMHGKN